MTSEFLSKINLDLIKYCGYVEGAEIHADGSADNDLALERADVAHDFLRRVKEHSSPSKLLQIARGTVLEAGDPVDVIVGAQEMTLQGKVKHLGSATGKLIVVVDEET